MPGIANRRRRFPLRLQRLLPILLWLGVGVILISLLWVFTEQKIAFAKQDADTHMREQAVVAANSYAQQLQQMIEQIDQITLRLKYHWEDPDIPVNLEKDKEHGILPNSQLIYATIHNAQGIPVTTTSLYSHKINVSGLPYFRFHQHECCAGLLISPPSPSLFTGRPIVRFTRRLNRPDGTFDGVALVSVESPYLVTFQETAHPGKNDFISVRLTNGPLLASKVGSVIRNTPVFYRNAPIFPTAEGTAWESSQKFRDDRERFVAWKKLEKYPLVAIAGISVEDAMVPFRIQARNYRQTAALGSLLLTLLAIAASSLAANVASRRRRAEETQETYRLATDAANEGFYMFRPIFNRHHYAEDFQLDDCNNRAAELIGATRAELVGKTVSQLRLENFNDELMALCRLALEQGYVEDELRVPHGSPVKADWVYRRVVSSLAGIAMTLRDISAEKQHEQALYQLANSDMLTMLPNRNWLMEFLPTAIDQAARANTKIALLFIDLDNFKNINDTLGHEAGDELLIQAGRRLKAAVRESDHVARLGGDEFVVILHHVDTEEDISRVAKAIIRAIGQPFSLEAGTGHHVNASIGISLFPQDGRNAETLLKHADVAMYAAKASGKGRFVFYQTRLSDTLVLRLSKERALREAIAHDQFVMYFQPRVSILSGQLTSMEALIRWDRPEHRLIYPSEFIDLAEDMGLIVEIGELVVEKVCRQIAQWKQQGLSLVPISFNVSPKQLKSGTLSRFVAASIARYGIESCLLEAELTESAVIDHSEVVSNELAALRNLGIKLLIDDFGTGYSSMAQLHRLDVDVLKVDQAFTRALSLGAEGETLFRAIVSMANALKISVVAEGVETIEELNVLEALSCDEIQGYLVSQAVDAAEMTKMILKRFLLAPHGATSPLTP